MPHMTCTACQVKLEIKKTGVNLVTMFLSPPEPYEVFDADLWECPSCGREIVAGVADQPFKQHWQEGFGAWYETLKANANAVTIIEYERPQVLKEPA